MRLWDAEMSVEAASLDIGEQGHSLAWSQDGRWLCVGCRNGAFKILEVDREKDLLSMALAKKPFTEQVSAVAFSHDCEKLVVSSHKQIGVYSALKDFTRLGRCKGHTSCVTAMDWSLDGDFLRSSSTDHELLYWDVAACQQITASGPLRDVQWARPDCVPVSAAPALNAIGQGLVTLSRR